MTSATRLAQFDRSQLAQRNDDEHGYWLSIDHDVYDVSEFMRSHPGGARILQLYAGRDATHGFERAHVAGRHVALLLERCRIGTLRQARCIAQSNHAAHHAAYRALDGVLALVVEMQNALRVDHAFRLEPLDGPGRQARPAHRSRYELQRGVETHLRFHREYLEVLASEGLTQLASSVSPAPRFETGMRVQREHVECSPECVRARAWALELLTQFEHFADDALRHVVARFEACDSWLLRAWKRELSRGLRSLERPHAAGLRLQESPSVSAVCERLVERLREYYRRAVPTLVVRGRAAR